MGGDSGCDGGERFFEESGEVFVDVRHPVGDKNSLILEGDGSSESDHDIDPRGELGFDEKLGVGTILASAIGDLVIDDDDFAVVAEVDATAKEMVEETADGQGDDGLNACGTHCRPEC